MEPALYLEATVAVIATLLAISNRNPLHAVLYLIVSLLAVAMLFFSLGAPFAGVLEVIIYAGAIMVLFVFVVMLLNLGKLARVLVQRGGDATVAGQAIAATQVGVALYGPYLLAAELASMLLLAGLVTAFHLGRHE
jgi:NADH-quinone oxidoreductase subunit J